MNAVSVLPKLFRWVFTALVVIAVLGAFGVCVAMLVNPTLPPGTHFGPLAIDVLGQPGTVAMRAVGGDSDFTLTALRGSLTLFVAKAGGLIEILKRYGLPLILINLIFFAVLFELLRRLFRNVGRGESFTRQNVLLVQIVGAALIVYSLVSAVAERWFAHVMLNYVAQNATVTISGTSLHLPPPHGMAIFSLHGFPFGSPVFLCGLLVLALSEVFRQGLTLKNENDLTV
jgi:hypothetical protein